MPQAQNTLRALRHTDFLMLWLGQVISLTGSWMQSTAQGWLVLRLSNSPLQLGLIGFCNLIPFLIFALPAGVAADRLPRKRTLLITQTSAMMLAAALAVLTWSGLIQVWHIAILAFTLGTVMAFDIPVRQSLLQDMVGRDDLPNAIALNSVIFNLARMAGPAIAGFVVAAWGESICFLANAVSFCAVLPAIAALRVGRTGPGGGGASWGRGIGEGLYFAWRTPNVRLLLQLVLVSSIFGMPYAILMPVFARDILNAGSVGLGWLMAASGAGAMAGAIYVASRKSIRGQGRFVGWAVAVFGGGLMVFASSRELYLSMACLFVVGAAMIIQMSTSNAVLQLTAPAELRGRVVSLYMLCFVGMAPIGSLLAGWMTEWIGTAGTVGLGGAVCLTNAAVFAMRKSSLHEHEEHSD